MGSAQVRGTRHLGAGEDGAVLATAPSESRSYRDLSPPISQLGRTSDARLLGHQRGLTEVQTKKPACLGWMERDTARTGPRSTVLPYPVSRR